jgi:hypothetical protein
VWWYVRSQILLPKGCCRIEYYSDVYIHSYKCNLLGIKPSVDVPLGTALCILIEVSDTPFSEDDETAKKSLPAGVRIVVDRRTPEELASVRSYSDSVEFESADGPHSLLVRVGSAEEIVDLSTIHYRVLHAPGLLPSKGWPE